jgi:hypothetical protein
MLRRFLIACFVLLIGLGGKAQLNNDWIDYNKTYYKFQLAKDTLCRISGNTLASLGLGQVNANHFQLWRNGKQVRLHTSQVNSPLGTTDYIEFWGEMNDGKPDLQLYRNPDFQLSDRFSLETDTSAYFLCIDPTGNNLRYQSVTNNAPSALPASPFCFRRQLLNFRNQIFRGEAKVVGEYVYSSSYEMGEGWTSPNIAPCCDLVRTFNNLNVYTGNPNLGFSFFTQLAGNAPNVRNIRVRMGSTEITSAPYSNPVNISFFEYRKLQLNNLPLSLFTNPNSVTISINGTSTNASDRIVVAGMGFRYPALPQFNNARLTVFEMDSSSSPINLEISQFNTGGLPPILLDETNGLRMVGEIASTPGRIKFELPPSAVVRVLRLIKHDEWTDINAMQTRNFRDLRLAGQQGDYLIVSHQDLYDDGTGYNPVSAYKDYRESVVGGGYKVNVYEINELTDQFGFGISNHPGSIRDFIRYASETFQQAPKFVLIIGRGVSYMDWQNNINNPLLRRQHFVPTFGWPASDILLASEPGSTIPLIPIGRIGAIEAREVDHYLQKLIEYEQAQQFPSPEVAQSIWKKNVLYVVGGKDTIENMSFRNYMESYAQTIRDTFYGGNVEMFSKTSTGTVQQTSVQRIQQLFEEGLGFIGYFGHSSANTFEFNLSNPDVYNSRGKYPFFNVSGCSAGNYYLFDPLRNAGNNSISEKYVLSDRKGSIGFLADTHFGIPPFLNYYNTAFYRVLSNQLYGEQVGSQMNAVAQELGGGNPSLDFFTRIHLEQVNLHGDPAVRLIHFNKPDMALEDQHVRISPAIISVADNRFQLNVRYFNLGKVINDSVRITIRQRLPGDSVRLLFNQRVLLPLNKDSIQLEVPIFPITDKGLNRLIVELDADQQLDELHETNNRIEKDFFIYEDELRITYPYPYSIVNQSSISFFANTANPLSGTRTYRMEIDTTRLFNSPFKRSYQQTGTGGLVAFNPGFTLNDQTVYYWRVSMDPLDNTNPIIWNEASFVYLENGGGGFNQSHVGQWKDARYQDMRVQDNGQFSYNLLPKTLNIRSGLFPFYDYDRVNVNLDLEQLELWGCATLWRPGDSTENNLQFYVFDSATLATWRNSNQGASGGRFGSRSVCLNSATPYDTSRAFFEFQYSQQNARLKAMQFIDSIPDGMYFAITNFGNNRNKTFIDRWMNDTLLYGSGQSLYHKLKSVGFSTIDSFYRNRPFLFFARKGNLNFIPIQEVGRSDSSYIDRSIALSSTGSSGIIESPLFGPASRWEAIQWLGDTLEQMPGDTIHLELWGQQRNGQRALLKVIIASNDTLLDFVDANQYPHLFVRINLSDPVHFTPNQLKYLRLRGKLLPEGSVAPSIQFVMKDTLEQGEPLVFALPFKNISDRPFDSLLSVRLTITDRNNVSHIIPISPRKALIPGDTLLIQLTIDTRSYVGNNLLSVSFNPTLEQPEQYLYNNLLYRSFFVRSDQLQPLLDVTFDGVHILNRDIISAKPHIEIKLKDENRFMQLSDTSLFKVKVTYPDQQTRVFRLGDTLQFTPASLGSVGNVARLDFKPSFDQDGDYELEVEAKDEAGNQAGDQGYKVGFRVINQAMISNVYNYPNPFTSRTAFVFTLTGSELPQQLRIQILTVTGKVVREITQQELGPLQIGRNITTYQWDGTDQFGQPLGNGVYLYRILTNLNGKSLEKFQDEATTSAEFFRHGYGKMYLMR